MEEISTLVLYATCMFVYYGVYYGVICQKFVKVILSRGVNESK
jgi:hypothetical protein